MEKLPVIFPPEEEEEVKLNFNPSEEEQISGTLMQIDNVTFQYSPESRVIFQVRIDRNFSQFFNKVLTKKVTSFQSPISLKLGPENKEFSTFLAPKYLFLRLYLQPWLIKLGPLANFEAFWYLKTFFKKS